MRVLIADDHPLFRDGLRSLLEARGIDVVGEAATGRLAVSFAEKETPDIVLMDLAMPDLTGLEATRLIVAACPAVKVVVLTASEDDADLFESIKSGAQGYLLKNLESDQFFRLLEGVARGEPALSPALARKLLAAMAHPQSADHAEPSISILTDRELEVLHLLILGVTSNRELAERLTVSENTIKFHLRNILDKLHLQNRAQVVSYALRHGLVPAGESGPS